MTEESAAELMADEEKTLPITNGEAEGTGNQKSLLHLGNVTVNRPVQTQLQFNENYHPSDDVNQTCWDVTKSSCRKKCCNCSSKCWLQSVLTLFPFLETFRQYKLRYLPPDVMAGLSVGIIHIPQGLGFALLTSVPPVYGLYSSFWPVIFYFMFGTSRHNSLGTMAIVSLIIGAAVDQQMAGKFPQQLQEVHNESTAVATNGTSMSMFDFETERVKIAVLITFLAGLIQLLMGICHLGLVTILMPMSFVSGFTTAAAFHISTSQIKHLFGIKISAPSGIFRLPLTWAELARHLPETNPATIVITILALFFLIILKEIINARYNDKLKMPIPAELLVVVIAIICSYLINVNQRYDVILVGDVPRGIPMPALPDFELAQNVISDAFIVAIISFTISISMAKLFGNRYQYTVDGNKELTAYGLTHIFSSFFHCFAGCSAPPRCFVYDSCGGKTSVAHLFSAVLVLLVMLALGPYFSFLPNSILGCVIIVALFPLFKQFSVLKQFWVINKMDVAIWVVTWATTVFLDIGIGLGIGVGFVLLSLVIQAFQARGHTLIPTPEADLFYQVDQMKSYESAPRVFIFKYDHNLNFTTVQRFQQMFNERLKVWRQDRQANHEKRCDIDITTEKTTPPSTGETLKMRNGSLEENVGKKRNSGEPLTGEATSGGEILNEPSGAVIIDASAFTHLDVMAVNTLRDVSNKLANQESVNVLAMANCCTSVQVTLERAGLVAKEIGIKGIILYPTLQDAVSACQHREMALHLSSAETGKECTSIL